MAWSPEWSWKGAKALRETLHGIMMISQELVELSKYMHSFRKVPSS